MSFGKDKPKPNPKLVEEIFQRYRSSGFPYLPTDKRYRDAEFNEFMTCKHKALLVANGDGFDVGQDQKGQSFCWSYMPHSYGVKCGTRYTAMETFQSDERLRGAIEMTLQDQGVVTDTTLLHTLKLYKWTQCVSNFRPTAAAAIYHHFCPEGGRVWDMSCGYGGRLLGSIKVRKVLNVWDNSRNLKYIGTDPCTATMEGLRKINAEYNQNDAELHLLGSEVFEPEPASLDFAFTSPPYFDTEKYSDEETQSYKKYPNRALWVHKFMRQTLTNVHRGLKPTRFLALNIADVESDRDLCPRVLKVAAEVGFRHVATWRLLMASLVKEQGHIKFEPIYILRRLG